jgi:hypothetical protein
MGRLHIYCGTYQQPGDGHDSHEPGAAPDGCSDEPQACHALIEIGMIIVDGRSIVVSPEPAG